MISVKKHFNKPQLRSMVINAPNEVFVAGRGTGKTEGVLAPKTAFTYFKTMPRGCGVFLGTSYTQLVLRTIPALRYGWEKLGYIENVHFFLQKRPDAKFIKRFDWKGPFRRPDDYKYFVSWWNGAGAHFISQTNSGGSNGITIDWICNDEAKFTNQTKLETELLPANRGIIPEFADNPHHHGVTYTTDMPVGTAGRWILDMFGKMDQVVINDIWGLQLAKYKLKALAAKASVPVKKEIAKQIEVIDDELLMLRRGLLYYHEASAIDNIHALGLDYVKAQLLKTTAFNFDTQILNIRPIKLEAGFYPDFDEQFHGYYSENKSYFDADLTLDSELDCRKDADLDTNAPLHIGLDYNKRIHPIAIAQVYPTEIRMVKGIASLFPGKLQEAMDKFTKYYRFHKRKMVYFWYDHTAIGDQHKTRQCDDVIAALRKAGWSVKGMYIGMQPGHESRYRMMGHVLSEDGVKYDKKITFNRENCLKMILSINQAGTEARKDGFGKDKKTEHDDKFPADESTHYTDAFDTVVFGILESGLRFGDYATPTSSIIMG